jgi:pyruvate carboxylase subunit B
MLPRAGAKVKAGEPMGYIQTYYGMEEIVPAVDGRILAVCSAQGEQIVKGETVAIVLPDKKD